MASALIHMIVAKKVNEKLNLDVRSYLLGSIAPDIAKMVGSERMISHFTGDSDISTPNIKEFLKKYRSEMDKPFEVGYLVHLLTDVLWFDEFLPNFLIETQNTIIDKEGNKVKFTNEEIKELIYNDYTNLNEQLLDYYNFDLSLFYEPFDLPESHIEELPSIYLGALITKMGVICANSTNYSYTFDIEQTVHFIEYATMYVLDELKKIGI